ncbi:unnamed protein product [Adineta ricciae]|uniref:MULE transposase domain-containing protein n=1 Tax=Adineta ricciae TaxID=249248 RepID=A0A813SHJ1_ADIRI|nr:unnamed protein product [Adineta ricciae]
MVDDDLSWLSLSTPTESSLSSSLIEYSSSSSSSSSLTENSSSPTDLPNVTVNKTVSNKRKLMLEIDGYHFQLKDYSKDRTKKFWRCANRACRVIVHTTIENKFKCYGGKSSVHSHLPNPSGSEVRNLREAMRKRAENETTSLQKIAEQEVRQALLTGEALAALPRINNLGHNLLHQRRKATPPGSYDNKFQLKQLDHMRSEGRLLVWSSDIQLNLLFSSQKVHMDGTFSTSPPQFEQVFIIQAFVQGSCVPVLYALVSDRKTPEYVHLFNVLFNEAERFNKKFEPELIMTDFEPSLSKAISLEFADSTIQKGCFFHFTKAVYRNVQSCGLTSVYLNNMVIRSVVRRMMALALVPAECVPTLFDDLQNDLSEYERHELAPLFNTKSSDFVIIDETSSSSSSSFSSSSKPTIGEKSSNKRKPMLKIDGYQFQMKDFNKSKTLKFWRCTNRLCNVILLTNLNDEFVKFSKDKSDHSHLPNPATLEIRNLREQMRKRAENELLSLQQIYEQEVRQGLLTGEALVVLPNILNLGHNLVNNRRVMMPLIPQSYSCTIPDEYKNDYLNKDHLLLHDSYDPQFSTNDSLYTSPEGRILIWSSDIQLKLLFDSDKLYMDGTFSTSPPNFDQMYIIQAIYHESCLPAVFSLLPDRKATTHIYLFHVLFSEAKRLKKKFNPCLLMTNFEQGVSRAVSIMFAGATVHKGCFFRFCQAIYRNVQFTGLSSAYFENLMIRSVIRQMALALVPEEHVLSLFAGLGAGLDESERDQLSSLFTYFERQWLSKISMWNVFNIRDKTNNFPEGM